jgi:hypothetical protein
MTDAFSFRAARPKKVGETPQHDLAAQVETLGADSLLSPEPVRRKRRTRAEIEAAQPAKEEAPDMLVLKACLIQLRTLKPAAAARVIDTLAVVFK